MKTWLIALMAILATEHVYLHWKYEPLRTALVERQRIVADIRGVALAVEVLKNGSHQ